MYVLDCSFSIEHKLSFISYIEIEINKIFSNNQELKNGAKPWKNFSINWKCQTKENLMFSIWIICAGGNSVPQREGLTFRL